MYLSGAWSSALNICLRFVAIPKDAFSINFAIRIIYPYYPYYRLINEDSFKTAWVMLHALTRVEILFSLLSRLRTESLYWGRSMHLGLMRMNGLIDSWEFSSFWAFKRFFSSHFFRINLRFVSCPCLTWYISSEWVLCRKNFNRPVRYQ